MLERKRPVVLLAVAILVALLAMTIAVVLVPSLSWAGVLEWITTTPPCEAPCD